jgi:hypothetical protein
MSTAHYFAMAFAVTGLVVAIVAAVYWWKASRVAIVHTSASISDVPELYILSGQVAFNESSQLNCRAAIWTGASAILSAIASVLGVM